MQHSFPSLCSIQFIYSRERIVDDRVSISELRKRLAYTREVLSDLPQTFHHKREILTNLLVSGLWRLLQWRTFVGL